MTAYVHIDVDSAMNGISQFVYRDPFVGGCPRWIYSKIEEVTDVELLGFTHVISVRSKLDGFCPILIERKFTGFDWRSAKLREMDHTFVHRNVNVSNSSCLEKE